MELEPQNSPSYSVLFFQRREAKDIFVTQFLIPNFLHREGLLFFFFITTRTWVQGLLRSDVLLVYQ